MFSRSISLTSEVCALLALPVLIAAGALRKGQTLRAVWHSC